MLRIKKDKLQDLLQYERSFGLMDCSDGCFCSADKTDMFITDDDGKIAIYARVDLDGSSTQVSEFVLDILYDLIIQGYVEKNQV